jgi:flagellar basal-body rod modification protein FlgD
MATSAITSTTSTAASAVSGAATAGAGSKPMDKEAFLKLLVAQIQNQDPMKPMEGTEFVSQLSQFAMVEQAIAQSTQLGNVSAQLGGIANNDSTALVGKQVTVRGKSMVYDGATAASSAVTLEGAATKVTAEVVDANGKTVRTLDLGPQSPGALRVVWDGKDLTGNPAPKGTYTLRVAATTADGSPVSTTQDVTGVVTKISFDKGYPELSLDNGATCPISDLVGVTTPTPKP